MAKKPAITGVARPQGWIDDTLKAIGKRMSKPAEVTVNVGRKSSSVKKVTVQPKRGEGVAGPTLPKGRPTVKIDSKPKVYNETYTKGTKEYKDAIKAKRRDESALKKVNKYNPASVRRGQEYKVARAAEKDVNQMKKTMGKTFSDVLPQKTAVDKFVGMKPRKVKSGRR
jgi:hypothetical protein